MLPHFFYGIAAGAAVYCVVTLALWWKAIERAHSAINDALFSQLACIVRLDERLSTLERHPWLATNKSMTLKVATVTRDDEPEHLASCAAYQGSYFFPEDCNCAPTPKGAT